MFTLVGPNQMRDDLTGKVEFIDDVNAARMEQFGTLKRGGDMGAPAAMGGSGGGQGYQPGVMRNTEMPGGGGGGMRLGRNQAVAPPGGIRGVDSMAPAKLASAAQISAPETSTAPKKFTRIPATQQSQQAPLVRQVYTPGHRGGMRPVSEQTSGVSTPLQENLFLEEQRLYDNQLKMANADAETELANRLGRQFEAQAVSEEKRNLYNQNKATNELKLQRANEQIGNLDRAVKEAREQPITSWHEDVGGVGVLLSALAMAGGAYAQGMNGGQNAAMEIINRTIDRDTSAKLNAKQDRVDAASEARENFVRQFAFNRDERRQYEMMLREESLVADTDKILADEQMRNYWPQVNTIKSGLQAQSLDRRTQLAQLQSNSVMKHYDPGSAGGWSYQATPEAQQAIAEQKVRKAAGLEDAGTVGQHDVMSSTGERLGKIEDPVEVRRVNDTIAKSQLIENMTDQLLSLHQAGYSPANETKYNVIKNRLISLTKKPGENSDADAERLTGTIGDYKTWFKTGHVATETFRETARLEKDNLLRQYRANGSGSQGLPGRALTSSGEQEY